MRMSPIVSFLVCVYESVSFQHSKSSNDLESEWSPFDFLNFPDFLCMFEPQYYRLFNLLTWFNNPLSSREVFTKYIYIYIKYKRVKNDSNVVHLRF